MGRHANVKDKLLVVSESPLDMLDFSLSEGHSQSFIQVKLELGKVILKAHVDIPVRLRNDAWNQPIGVFKVFIISTLEVFWNWQRTQEVRREEVGLQLVISQIFRRELIFGEDQGLCEVDHRKSLAIASACLRQS